MNDLQNDSLDDQSLSCKLSNLLDKNSNSIIRHFVSVLLAELAVGCNHFVDLRRNSQTVHLSEDWDGIARCIFPDKTRCDLWFNHKQGYSEGVITRCRKALAEGSAFQDGSLSVGSLCGISF